MRPSLTIGIEEEYQTIDPVTRDMRSHIEAEMISKGKTLLKEAVKAEMHQSVVEIGTGICQDIKEACTQVKDLRSADLQTGEAERAGTGGVRDASLCGLAQAGDLSGRPVSR